MEIITIILSGLALLAASVSLILTIWEKKRSEERNAATLVDKAKNYEEELRYKAAVSTEMEKVVNRISDLENGVVPDYNEALAAKEAVDNFNVGIAGILGFDPLKAAKEMREGKSPGGGE